MLNQARTRWVAAMLLVLLNVFALCQTAAGADGRIVNWEPSPDGNEYIIEFTSANNQGRTLQVKSLLSSDQPSIQIPDAYCASWDPCSEKIAYVLMSKKRLYLNITEGHVTVLDLNKNRAVALTAGPSVDGLPVWNPRGDAIAMIRLGLPPAKVCARLMLWRQAAESKCAVQIGQSHSGISHLAWHPSGDRLAYIGSSVTLGTKQVLSRAADVYLLDLKSGKTTALSTDGCVVESEIAWSPDGRYLAYVVAEKKTLHSLLKIRDIVSKKTITADLCRRDKLTVTALRWSPDGKRILVGTSLPDNGKAIALVDWPKTSVYWLPGSGSAYLPRWTRDGEGILYIEGEGIWKTQISGDWNPKLLTKLQL